jgi:predicted nucleotidyltransferase
MSDERLNSILSRVSQFARSVFGASLDEVILYGSYARGDYDDESDIDIMILVDLPSEQLRKYRQDFSYFAADLGIESGVLVSTTLQSKAHFDEWRENVGYFHDVDIEGVRVIA